MMSTERGFDFNSRNDLEKSANDLNRSEADLRRIFDAIAVLAWSSGPDGTADFFNRRWHEYTGLSPDDSRGWGWKSAIHPDDLPGLNEKWGSSREINNAGECEVRLRRSDGAFRWFLLQREPLTDGAGAVVGWSGIAIDIEDRKRTEWLYSAEMQTLQMIAHGASLVDILNHVCTSNDLQI